MNNTHIHVSDDVKSLIEDTADWLEARIAATTGPFALALSGGSTPKPLYEALAQPPRAGRIDWSRVHLFWGDERFVPYDDPESNYRMVKLALIDHVPIPAGNVHPVPVDGTPQSAAERYARTLQEYYGAAQLTPQRLLFSVNLLGIGDDGHTASLFPGAPQLEEKQAWTVSSVGQRPEPRVSLTFPALASADAVVFLAAGEKKRDPVARARKQDPALPSGRVRSDGELFWFLDRAAAGE